MTFVALFSLGGGYEDFWSWHMEILCGFPFLEYSGKSSARERDNIYNDF